jgi:hypothetical protein
MRSFLLVLAVLAGFAFGIGFGLGLQRGLGDKAFWVMLVACAVGVGVLLFLLRRRKVQWSPRLLRVQRESDWLAASRNPDLVRRLGAIRAERVQLQVERID